MSGEDRDSEGDVVTIPMLRISEAALSLEFASEGLRVEGLGVFSLLSI